MTKNQISAALREATFNPNKLGPLKVIADVGDIDYYIRRAIEFLILSLSAFTSEQQLHYLNTALSLVALAKVKINDKEN